MIQNILQIPLLQTYKIASKYTANIQKFDSEGTYLTTWGSEGIGTTSS
jgi:hypothetical protein